MAKRFLRRIERVRFTAIPSHARRMPFVPAGVVTGIGSLPLMSMTSAVRSVAEFSPEVPFWPQLPRLSERESVIGQGLGIVADHIEPRKEGYGYQVKEGRIDSVLEILFAADPEGTRLTLVHSGIPDGQGETYHEGWQSKYFAPMREHFAKTKPAKAARAAPAKAPKKAPSGPGLAKAPKKTASKPAKSKPPMAPKKAAVRAKPVKKSAKPAKAKKTASAKKPVKTAKKAAKAVKRAPKKAPRKNKK